MKNNVKFIQDLYENKKDCLWYSGDVAVVEYKNAKFYISAQGDVVGTVYKDGIELRRFKDKSHRGDFAHVIDSYIPEINNDKRLHELLNSDLSEDEIAEKKLSAIVLTNNNWWEVFIDVNGETYPNSYSIDFTDNFDEALEHVIENLDYIYNEYVTA